MKLLWLIRRGIGGLWRALITSRLEDGDDIMDGPFVDDNLSDDGNEPSEN